MSFNGTAGSKAQQISTMMPARFEVLDSWRGICALLVAAFHFPLSGALSQTTLLRHSYLFVDFFFVLSGFVIAHAYVGKLIKGEGGIKFMVTRFGRLAPLHFFMLGLLVMLEIARWLVPALSNGNPVFSGRNTLDALIVNLMMIQGLGVMDHLSWNTPSWSISTELFAYFIFAISLTVFGLRGIIVMALIAIAAPVILWFASPDLLDVTYDYGLVRCLYGFSVGVLTHLVYKATFQSVGTSSQDRAKWTVAEVAILFAIVDFVIIGGNDTIGITAPVMFALAVLVFVNEGGWISTMLKSRPFLVLGSLSYSIYMTHMLVQAMMHALARLVHNRLGFGEMTMLEADGINDYALSLGTDMLLLVLMLSLTVALSYLTWRFVETPANAWFRRFASQIGAKSSQPNRSVGRKMHLA